MIQPLGGHADTHEKVAASSVAFSIRLLFFLRGYVLSWVLTTFRQ